ncbi:hypothetical protein ASG06_06935 [Rathayibacter sp. Leaf185]|nr:hypothetical protein ASF42_06935 [Rathayibacter sp. Leaf294]KQS14095.1 hypothetical protein ASG06_06935 [Rathayibacter sp. Leaf185]
MRLHWDPAWPDDEPLRVSIGHALLQLGRTVGVEDMLVALESALEKRLLDRDDVDLIRSACPARLHAVIDFAAMTQAAGSRHSRAGACTSAASMPGPRSGSPGSAESTS